MASDSDDLDISLFSEKFKKAKKKIKKGNGQSLNPACPAEPWPRDYKTHHSQTQNKTQ